MHYKCLSYSSDFTSFYDFFFNQLQFFSRYSDYFDLCYDYNTRDNACGPQSVS